MWRLLDLMAAVLALVVLSPLFLVCTAWVVMDDGFPIFFKQQRIGKGGEPFHLLKFRTMYKDASRHGLITVGKRDPRITRSGYFLRKYKLDELPQLFNVLAGQMSLVGPRPEVQKYVNHYPQEYDYLLRISPGITSPASLVFSNENEILAREENPEQYYLQMVLPEKIRLDRVCVEDRSLGNYFSVIFKTLAKVFTGNKN